MPAPTAPQMQVLPVGRSSEPSSVASAAVRFHDEGKTIELHAVGVSAFYQAAKAMVRMNTFLAEKGLRVWTSPVFRTENVHGQRKTVLVLPLRFLSGV